ncbi:MAG TPA: hypothetical protein VKU02_04340 [Gemmataceae bacterium]|nr:hypothetical protein [Gemmataceae bacterium]
MAYSGWLRMVALLLLCIVQVPAMADEPASKQAAEKIKEVAGSAEFLRSVPKRFATLQAIAPAAQQVTLLIDGEDLPKVWSVVPDAELKITGWWGRLDQFRAGDRVWLWFKTDRQQQPVAISMMADELSEQDIHGPGVTVEARTAESITLKPVVGKSRTLKTATTEVYSGPSKDHGDAALERVHAGDKVYVQSAGGTARLIMDKAAFEIRRAEQKAQLRKRWQDEGLPGTVTFLHIFSGEMDFMLDHEAMRWARSLKLGDQVTLQATPPIQAVVKHVVPWRERTQLRLVVHSKDQADLTLGQRLALRMQPPSDESDSALLPLDLNRPRTKAERIDWFLASIYCTCGIKGDNCTGHFYTLASCNPNGCGMPHAMRELLAERIDKGLTDKQIFEELLKKQGPDLVRQHLMP